MEWLLNAVIEHVVHLFFEGHGDECVWLFLGGQRRYRGCLGLHSRRLRVSCTRPFFPVSSRNCSEIRGREHITSIFLALSVISMFQVFIEGLSQPLDTASIAFDNADPLNRRWNIA